MGYMTVLMVLNDCLDDENLGAKVNAALSVAASGKDVELNGVKAFRSFHADETRVFAFGQNTVRVLNADVMCPSNSLSIEVLQAMAANMNCRLVPNN